MNYDVNKENLSELNIAFDGCKEVPIDIDFTLPDYCPDIQKILKCSVKPSITSRSVSGGQITVDGHAEIKIIYIDSESSKIRCCENSAMFSAPIDIKNSSENIVAFTNVKTEYMNCRAVSPRKIDLHGALSVCATIYEKNDIQISSSVSGKDIEQKIEKLSLSNLVGMGQQQFSISETLEINENKPSPEMIINSEVIFLKNEPKIMPNKVVIKGDLVVKILYIGDMESGNIEKLEYQIPISQIVDVPGISEKCRCITKFEILETKLTAPQSGGSESANNLISADIKCAAAVFAFCGKEVDAVLDAYSREYNVKNTFKPLKTQKLLKTFAEEQSFRGEADIPDINIKEIINISPNILGAKGEISDDKIKLNGKLSLDIFGTDLEDTPFYAKRTIDFEIPLSETADEKDAKIESEIIPTDIKVTSGNDGKIEFRVTVVIYINAYKEQNHMAIAEIEADENNKFDKDKNFPATVYFAEKNESVWDIARKYHSSVSSVKEENDLSEDILEDSQMILIPSK